MAPEQLHGQAMPATDLYALGATIVALAGGIEPEDVPRKGLMMDLAAHLPAMDGSLRHALIAMTDPDPDKRPQRARDVATLLTRALPPAPKAPPTLTRQRPATMSRRSKMFGDVGEPLGTLLRFTVLSFGAGGWLGMASLRVSITILSTVIAIIAFPARRKVVGVSRELDSMLAEGQGGFTDMMRGAMERK
jgi:hypothetical protein